MIGARILDPPTIVGLGGPLSARLTSLAALGA
jgi:hypothetical protein